MIATTINMHPDTLTAVSRAARKLNTSRREIIVRLLRHMKDNIDAYQGGYTTVSYQRDDPEKKWRCFTIKLSPEDVECLGDMRYYTRCSVSLMVNMAAERYLDEVVQETHDAHHNGRCNSRSTICDERRENMT
jgi:hypothetical protein